MKFKTKRSFNEFTNKLKEKRELNFYNIIVILF